MSRTFEAKQLLVPSDGMPRYERIAEVIEAAIDQGDFGSGDRLPTVRALASQLDVSGASVAVAYSLLARRGRVHAQVGRGTFVSPPPAPKSLAAAREPGTIREVPRRAGDSSRSALTASWRRRALRLSDRLRGINPEALACTASWPDSALLPTEVLKRAYVRVIEQMRPGDLQYTGPEAHPELIRALLPRLEREGIPAEPDDLIVMSSIKQVLALTLRVASMVVESRELVVAVEEPGQHTMFDTIESLGHHLVGVELDGEGAIPESLDAALERGANVVLFTPRALNPTGASWTAERRAALADVLARHSHAIVIEDDYYSGIVQTAPGSLLGDQRVEERVIYARSFSKSVAPDLRVTVVAARPKLRALLRDAKLVTDGWSPRITQRALAAALEDPELDIAFERARTAYDERRKATEQAILARLPAASVKPAADGVNIWVQLPAGCEALEVLHNAAELGVLVSSGEAFYIRPGRGNAVRLSIGWVELDDARRAGELLASAVLTVDDVPVSIVV